MSDIGRYCPVYSRVVADLSQRGNVAAREASSNKKFRLRRK